MRNRIEAATHEGRFSRRAVLGYLAALPALGGAWSWAASGSSEAEVTIEKFSAAGKSEGVVKLEKVVKTDEEWRSLLSSDAYRVTRRAGTERAFTGEYHDYKGDGLYRCVCCDTALYDSRTKFDSRTGWPSYWEPVSKHNVTEHLDLSHGMRRVEVACALCDAHLGHVFPDGPPPTGLRHCINSVALKFVERAEEAS